MAIFIFLLQFRCFLNFFFLCWHFIFPGPDFVIGSNDSATPTTSIDLQTPNSTFAVFSVLFEKAFGNSSEYLNHFFSFDRNTKEAKNDDFFIFEFHDFLQSIFQLSFVIFFQNYSFLEKDVIFSQMSNEVTHIFRQIFGRFFLDFFITQFLLFE